MSNMSWATTTKTLSTILMVLKEIMWVATFPDDVNNDQPDSDSAIASK